MPLDEYQRRYAEQKYARQLETMREHELDIPDKLFATPREGNPGDGYAAVELARYLVWLGAIGATVSGEALAVLALACVGEGMWWSEVAEDMGLPVPSAWE